MSTVQTPTAAPGASSRRGRRRERDGRGWQLELSPARAWPLVLPMLAIVGLFVVYPFVKLAVDSLTQGDGVGNYTAVLESGALRRAMITTLIGGVIVTALAVGIGAVMAWWLRTTERRGCAAVLWVALALPFCMGVVVKNYAFVLLLSTSGPINEALTSLGVVGEPLQLLYTRGAVIVGILYALLPYAVFSLYAAFSTVDPGLGDAARSMGASRFQAARSVILPLGLPGVVASATIAFALSIGFYVTPILLGGSKTPFVATLIQDQVFQYFDYPGAAAAAVILLVIALAILAVGFKAVGSRRLRSALA